MRVAVGLGGNLGDRYANLDAARRSLEGLPGASRFVFSSLYETAPVDAPLGTTQPDYLNAVAVFDLPAQSAAALVSALLALEADLGRHRGALRNEARTVDLDLLWIEGETSSDPAARVPHPRLHQRPFALIPLLEVLPGARDPAGMAYADHLARLDASGVKLARRW
ncbi:MAG: 2-amino-4-hydroxy-6-hydroxymethyldihydropteridine diphosphokinase [Myxococcales bacterium]|nr:2-amino-4-hydroxy-6-hydroxymethyldihydropteridine diphosphokinase [Myxococcales bacterium]